MKIIIFDSSSIISLALNNLLYVIKELKKNFSGKFIITEQVKREIIDVPLKTKKYGLEALMIFELLKDSTLELSSSLNLIEIDRETFNILEKANHLLRTNSEYIALMSAGEASCLALSNLLTRRGIENVVCVDERTARMLCEKPENLRKLLESKLHTAIKMERANLPSPCRIIRSSELCIIALKKNLIGIHDGRQLLDALLYGLKFKGCAISSNEIELVKKFVK